MRPADALAREVPADGWSPAQVGAYWAARGDWERAHEAVQHDDSRESAWVHAHLHREEGDLGNAAYWYRCAGRPQATGELAAERDALLQALFAGA